MVRKYRTRVGIAVGLALATGGLLALDGCGAILGIGDLPIDAGPDGTADATSDRKAPDHHAPDAGACVPACSGATPYCLDRACVECKPSSVGCSAAGAPQQCNGGGTWMPSPACGASTPYCLSGLCVQCLPSKNPPVCLPDGGLQFCSDAGLFVDDPCPCTNDECQRWPTGKLGDCRYDAGTYTRYDPGVVLDCKSLEIDPGATVAFTGNPEGGSPDAAARWTVIGVLGDAVINGTIVSQEDSLGHDISAKVQVPSADGGPGEVIVYQLVQAEGGAGGSAAWSCYGFADGGLAKFGNGGGGGGGTYIQTGVPLNPGSTACGTPCSVTDAGGPGQNAKPWSGGGGGYCPDVAADGGAGGLVFGAAGGDGVGSSVGSGGGGGARGKHGGLVYMRVLGTLSGAGSIDLSGQAGGAGGAGTGYYFSDTTYPFGSGCNGYFLVFLDYSGAGSGGGGGGGAGGAFVLRYQGDAGAFLTQVNVSGGPGGFQAFQGGNADNQAGENGAPGLIDAGPIPP
jgi:hypothetical protein